MKTSWRFSLASRIFLSLAVVFLCASVAGCLGFDGVVVLNLNADLGRARQGDELKQVVHIVNYTWHPITVLYVPTCGCASTDEGTQTLKAFSSMYIPVTYTIGAKMSKLVKRDVVIVYKNGDQVRRVAGVAHFTVLP